MRSAQEFNDVQRLIADGMNDCAIARITGIPRRTVRDWRCKPPIWPRNRSESASCRAEHYLSTIPAEAYCYLLGLYLGDGCISRHPRSFQLRITLDSKYPAIVDRCRQAVDILMPRQCARVRLRIGQLQRGVVVLKALAMPVPAARSRQETQARDSTRTLAASARRPGDRRVHPRPDPQRRVPRRRKRPRRHERPLSLLQRVRGHPRTVHRRTRRSRNTVDSVEQEDRLDLPQSRDRPPRHIRRAKDRAVPLNGVHYTA